MSNIANLRYSRSCGLGVERKENPLPADVFFQISYKAARTHPNTFAVLGGSECSKTIASWNIDTSPGVTVEGRKPVRTNEEQPVPALRERRHGSRYKGSTYSRRLQNSDTRIRGLLS